MSHCGIIRRCIQKFPDWVDNEITIMNTRCEATKRVMATKLIRLTHKIAAQLHLVAESCIVCSSRSRRPDRKLLDTPSYVYALQQQRHWKTQNRKECGKWCNALEYVTLHSYLYVPMNMWETQLSYYLKFICSSGEQQDFNAFNTFAGNTTILMWFQLCHTNYST
jgi:hypothetical protein